MALTTVFMSMRTVMDIGGTCGSGGPYEIAHSCPGNVAGLLPAAIWGGLIFTGLYVLVCVKWKVPSLVSLVWPALFLSLAYNFFDYGVRGAVNGGWIACGIVFALMGAVPLLWAVPHLWRVYVHGHEDDPKPWHVSTTGTTVGSAVDAMKLLDRLGRSSSEDMTESLERLDELHRAALWTTSNTPRPRTGSSAGRTHEPVAPAALVRCAPGRDRPRHLGRDPVRPLGAVGM